MLDVVVVTKKHQSIIWDTARTKLLVADLSIIM